MRKFDDFLEEQLQDEEFRREYEYIQPEFDVIRVVVGVGSFQYPAQNWNNPENRECIEKRIK